MAKGAHFDVSVLIGRFQPFHLGHAALLAKALECAPKVLIVLGSSHRSRSAKNPFTWEERADMIAKTLRAPDRCRLRFLPMRDFYDDLRWAEAVHGALEGECLATDRIALIGHQKDISSYYLTLFPKLHYVEAGCQGDFSATRLRQIAYEQGREGDLEEQAPGSVFQYLWDWIGTKDFENLRQEFFAVEESKQTWGIGPFITLDALVTAQNCVLLVRRGRWPGQGLWAIPGGFLDIQERLLAGAKRELLEETGLDLNDSAFGAALKAIQVFDHPDRSQRGRIITHVHHFELTSDQLPPVQGADDAMEARWLPLQSLPDLEAHCFEDHFHILKQFGLCG